MHYAAINPKNMIMPKDATTPQKKQKAMKYVNEIMAEQIARHLP